MEADRSGQPRRILTDPSHMPDPAPSVSSSASLSFNGATGLARRRYEDPLLSIRCRVNLPMFTRRFPVDLVLASDTEEELPTGPKKEILRFDLLPAEIEQKIIDEFTSATDRFSFALTDRDRLDRSIPALISQKAAHTLCKDIQDIPYRPAGTASSIGREIAKLPYADQRTHALYEMGGQLPFDHYGYQQWSNNPHDSSARIIETADTFMNGVANEAKQHHQKILELAITRFRMYFEDESWNANEEIGLNQAAQRAFDKNPSPSLATMAALSAARAFTNRSVGALSDTQRQKIWDTTLSNRKKLDRESLATIEHIYDNAAKMIEDFGFDTNLEATRQAE